MIEQASMNFQNYVSDTRLNDLSKKNIGDEQCHININWNAQIVQLAGLD